MTRSDTDNFKALSEYPEQMTQLAIERAGLWDVGVQRCVEISGPDAEAFMNLLTPRDVSKVAVGQCRYIFMTNQDGGVINDPVMLRMTDDRFWLSTADGDMYYTLRSYEVMEMLSKEGIPVQSHIGLIPTFSHWCGGLRDWGRNADEAMEIYRTLKRMEDVLIRCRVLMGILSPDLRIYFLALILASALSQELFET